MRRWVSPCAPGRRGARGRARLALSVTLLSCSAAAVGTPGSAGDAKSSASALPAPTERVATMVDELGAQERTLTRRERQLARQLRIVQALRLARGRSYVRLLRAGLLPAAGGFDALVDHASKLERLRHALVEDTERERQWRGERIQINAQLEQVRARRSVLAAEQAVIESSHSAIAAAREREEAFRRAFLGGAAPDGHTAVYSAAPGALPTDDRDASFQSQRGQLPLPLMGRTAVHDGQLAAAEGPALALGGDIGGRVVTIFRGRVAFASEYGAYGRTVIVDHGQEYFTLYAGLGSVTVAVGDELRAGATVGSVGNSGSIHLEIRHAGRTVNPRPWLGL